MINLINIFDKIDFTFYLYMFVLESENENSRLASGEKFAKTLRHIVSNSLYDSETSEMSNRREKVFM